MSCLIRIQNVNSFIEGNFPHAEIDRALSAFLPGAFMSKLYRFCQQCAKKGLGSKIVQKTGKCSRCQSPRAWDGRRHLLLGGKGPQYFPTGCLPIVADILVKKGIAAIYRDERGSVHHPDAKEAYKATLFDPHDPGKIIKLWPHQQDAVFSALTYERGVIQTPTSGGKTYMMSAISKILGLPTCIFINKTSLAKQLREEISIMTGEPVGYIGSGVFEPERITIGMTQTLCAMLGIIDSKSEMTDIKEAQAAQFIESTQLVMLDECHHASSQSWFTLTKAFKNAYYRFGLTGTAFMKDEIDDLLLMGATGNLIYTVEEKRLIGEEKIARPIIHIYTIDKPLALDAPDITYQEAYRTGVVENDNLNKLVAAITKNLVKNNAQILILSEQLDHVTNLSKHLEGVDHEILTGVTPMKERDYAQERFENSDLPVIIATNIFDEGISIHNIDVVIRTGLLKTDIKTKQQVGRGQRNKKNKANIVHIIDFFHTTNQYLENHSKSHLKMYKSLEYEIIMEDKPLEKIF
jgi:superfamily II DNA or RNA helicase